jgi:hypothetical protein
MGAAMTVDKKDRGWRDVLPVHPAADLFPLMSESELRELGEDIKANGLRSPIVLTDDMLLDGRNRLDAMELVGIKFELRGTDQRHYGKLVNDGISVLTIEGDRAPDTGTGIYRGIRRVEPEDAYDYAISANLHRRHLTGEQKRELIAKVLKAKPEASNAAVAKQVKADDKTVAKVRRKLESRSEIPNAKTRTDSKGRKQPSAKPKKSAKPVSPAKMELETPAPRSSGKAVAPQDNALSDFNSRLMELLRLIGRHPPTRFARTAVKADDLAKVGKFLSDLAQIKTAARRAKAESTS